MSNSEDLFEVAKNGNLEKVNELLNNGADPNKANENGVTPLIYASLQGNIQVVMALLQSGADPNKAKTDNGITPLYVACWRDNRPAVMALLEYGADLNKAVNSGETPIEAATRAGNLELVDILRDYERRNKTSIGVHMFKNTKLPYDDRNIPFDPNEHRSVYDDLDASTTEDLHQYIGKKGTDYGGRRRKSRKSKKSKKSRKTKKRRRL